MHHPTDRITHTTAFVTPDVDSQCSTTCVTKAVVCYPVCGMVYIKEPLLLIRKSSPCGGSGFPLSISEWSFTICPKPYNHKMKCVECVVK